MLENRSKTKTARFIQPKPYSPTSALWGTDHRHTYLKSLCLTTCFGKGFLRPCCVQRTQLFQSIRQMQSSSVKRLPRCFEGGVLIIPCRTLIGRKVSGTLHFSELLFKSVLQKKRSSAETRIESGVGKTVFTFNGRDLGYKTGVSFKHADNLIMGQAILLLIIIRRHRKAGLLIRGCRGLLVDIRRKCFDVRLFNRTDPFFIRR